VIEARDLTRRYGPTVAVDALSFDVRPGRVTGFLGPNGSGKSTTMRLILGLDRPDAGQVRVGGRRCRELRWPLREVGALAGVVPGLLLAGVLGVLTMTSEYSSGTIRVTLAAIPLRPLVLAAKAAVFGGGTLIWLLGLGLGAIIRHSAAAVGVLVAGVYVAAQAVGFVAQGVAAYMPTWQ
jgi:ABC-type cobalamin/Fe3+-siderophores transport system ATPase subunit